MSNKNIQWHEHRVDKNKRAIIKRQRPCILWFTGLSGSGKSTIANALEARLLELGCHTYLLDGDNLRHGLNNDLGFGERDRRENIRRIGEVARLFVDAGLLVLTAFISPYRRDRDRVRSLVDEGEFIEIFVDTSLETCEARDPKGLYRKARAGEIRDFTGIDAPYEAPTAPEIHLASDTLAVEEAVEQIIAYLRKNGTISTGDTNA